MKYLVPTPGLSVSNVALGAMRIGSMENTAVNQLIDTALEAGVNYIDHADIYGGGDCEALYGNVLSERKELRSQILIQTKCGIRSGFYDSSKEHILESVDNSLKRLRTDYLDALLIHRPDALTEPEEVAEAFGKLAAQGKVRFFGVSNHNPKQAVGQKLIINQLQLSVMHSSMIALGINVNTKFDGSVNRDGAVLDYSRLNHMMIQAWSPFQYGFFEGPFVDNEKFPELNKVLQEIADKYSITKTGAAAAWIVRIPCMMQIISGSTNPARLKEIVAGANTVLERPDWYRIYRAAGNELP